MVVSRRGRLLRDEARRGASPARGGVASAPLVRRLYRDWFGLVVARLAPVPGATVELGSGIGAFKEYYPAALTTDVEPTPWAERVADAELLPFEDTSVANLVLIDVFHHLARPRRFLDAAARVLSPGGRVIIVDAYCSPVSYRVYRRFHQERTDMSATPFADDPASAASPMAANPARATLVFFRHGDEFERRCPQLAVVEQIRLAFLLYPLSGGYRHRPLVPAVLYRPLAALERLLAPLAPLLAFRCLVVLERRPDSQPADVSSAGGRVRS